MDRDAMSLGEQRPNFRKVVLPSSPAVHQDVKVVQYSWTT